MPRILFTPGRRLRIDIPFRTPAQIGKGRRAQRGVSETCASAFAIWTPPLHAADLVHSRAAFAHRYPIPYTRSDRKRSTRPARSKRNLCECVRYLDTSTSCRGSCSLQGGVCASISHSVHPLRSEKVDAPSAE